LTHRALLQQNNIYNRCVALSKLQRNYVNTLIAVAFGRQTTEQLLATER